MMGALAAWIGGLPLVRDGHGYSIPRPHGFSETIAKAVVDMDDPAWFAANLDRLAAGESGYHTAAAGDCPGLPAGSLLCTRSKGAHACGAWQGLCASLPVKATPLEQAEQAVRDLTRARLVCPAHPLWAYASGSCRSTRVAVLYESEVSKTLADHPFNAALAEETP